MTDKYLLLYRKHGDSEWKSFLFSEVVGVGADENNTLNILDGELSGKHFELRENPTGIYLKDVDALAGETLLNGVSLPANRPVAVELKQVFSAGMYDFQVVLNVEDEEREESLVSQVSRDVKRFGLWKIGLIGIGIVSIVVIGAILIYNNFFKKPDHIQEIAATQIVNELVEITGTLVPTELFELSSTAVVEAVDGVTSAPGLGDFDLQAMLLDANEMDINDLMEFSLDPGQVMSMATTITGENVGYVYTYSGIKKDGKVITTGMEFLESSDLTDIDGVQTPNWGDGDIQLEMAWKPVMNYLENDSTTSMALLLPTIYGAADEDQVYRVDGIYQKLGSDTEYSAIARFAGDGSLIDILTFGDLGQERQTPYKVNFGAGDVFTPYELEFVHDPEGTQDMALDLAGNSLPLGWSQLLQLAIGSMEDGSFQFGIGAFQKHPGTPLVLGETAIRWKSDEFPDGDFVAGVAVEDLDGNLFVGYIPVLVKP